MSTQYIHRILAICPVGKMTAVATWIQGNVDATFPNPCGEALNATGLFADAITHYLWTASYTDSQAWAILQEICVLASVATPSTATWNGWTQAQKISWLQSVHAGVLAGYGLYVSLCDNTALSWDSIPAAIAAMGLQPRATF